MIMMKSNPITLSLLPVVFEETIHNSESADDLNATNNNNNSTNYKQRRRRSRKRKKYRKKKNRQHNKPKTKNTYYRLDYALYNWYEPTSVKGVNFHDTDVLISTTTTTGVSSSTPALVIAFAGTTSLANAVTNVQNFVPANYSRFFEPRQQHSTDNANTEPTRPSSSSSTSPLSSSIIQGSLHRGFLHAYSRVVRGSVLRMSSSSSSTTKSNANENTNTQVGDDSTIILDDLHKLFGHCTSDYSSNGQGESNNINTNVDHDMTNKHDDENDDIDDEMGKNMDSDDGSTHSTSSDGGSDKPQSPRKKKKKKLTSSSRSIKHGGCNFWKKEEELRLSEILKGLVNKALQLGWRVHVTGHVRFVMSWYTGIPCYAMLCY